MLPAPTQDGATPYTLHEAAQLLGVSLNTVRRKIARGELKATQVPRPQGHVWHVWLERTQDAAQHPTQGSTQHPANGQVHELQPVERVDQAEALARLVHEAVAPVERERDRLLDLTIQQAERIGRLEAELVHVRAQLALPASQERPFLGPTDAVPVESTTAPSKPKRLRWWPW